MSVQIIRALFYLSAAYDGSLAIIFIFAPAVPFQYFAVPPPDHWAYVQFPAAVLLIFAVMFLDIARDPKGNVNLIPYGILLKVAYCGVSGAYWYLSQLPGMWQLFFVCDLLMMIAYLIVYRQLTATRTELPVSGSATTE